ncbi:hypothetical protein WDU94_006771, partial [Cyamophila willieti]
EEGPTTKKLYHNEWNRSEQRNKIRNILLEGIPREPNEDVYQVVENVGHQLGIENPLEEVERADRAHLSYLARPEVIIIRLVDLYAKDKWLHEYRQRKLYHMGWGLHEHLTKASYDLLNMTRAWSRKHGFRYVWTRDCRILFRKNSQASAYHVNNVEHFHWLTNILEHQAPKLRGELRGPKKPYPPPSTPSPVVSPITESPSTSAPSFPPIPPAFPPVPPAFPPVPPAFPPSPEHVSLPPEHVPLPPEHVSLPSEQAPSSPPHHVVSPPSHWPPSPPPHQPVHTPPYMPPPPPAHILTSYPSEIPVSQPLYQPVSPPSHFVPHPPHFVTTPPSFLAPYS